VVSRYADPAILERARFLRSGRGKGIRRAIAEAKRAEAEAWNAATPPERRRRWRRDRPAGARAELSAAPAGFHLHMPIR
jgi:hypothetical protein